MDKFVELTEMQNQPDGVYAAIIEEWPWISYKICTVQDGAIIREVSSDCAWRDRVGCERSATWNLERDRAEWRKLHEIAPRLKVRQSEWGRVELSSDQDDYTYLSVVVTKPGFLAIAPGSTLACYCVQITGERHGTERFVVGISQGVEDPERVIREFYTGNGIKLDAMVSLDELFETRTQPEGRE